MQSEQSTRPLFRQLGLPILGSYSLARLVLVGAAQGLDEVSRRPRCQTDDRMPQGNPALTGPATTMESQREAGHQDCVPAADTCDDSGAASIALDLNIVLADRDADEVSQLFRRPRAGDVSNHFTFVRDLNLRNPFTRRLVSA